MKAFFALLVASLASFVVVFGQTHTYPYAGFYQPLTSASLVAASTPQVNTIPQATTGNVGTYSSPAVQAATLPDGTTQGTYAYRTTDGQVITLNYAVGPNGIVTSPGPSPTAAVATNTVENAASPFMMYSPQQQAGYPSYYPFSSFYPQPSTAYTAPAPQQVPQSAALTAAPGSTTGTVAEQVAAAFSPYQTVPLSYYGTNPQAAQQWQTLLV